jgi:precorrin-6x reductase
VKEVLIFGGTSEGRIIAEWCASHNVGALYCAATGTGSLTLPNITSLVGRLDAGAMKNLILQKKPSLVVDATHPYAVEVSSNIKAACDETNLRRVRVIRESGDTGGCETFSNTDELIAFLNRNEGIIFVTTGVKEAALFARVENFAERIFFRMLPGLEGLETCLGLGYKAAHLILMWGPFSRELNRAMFRAVGASILVTKDSGAAGGFSEKISAARDLGMKVALIARPESSGTAGDEAELSLEATLAVLEQHAH